MAALLKIEGKHVVVQLCVRTPTNLVDSTAAAEALQALGCHVVDRAHAALQFHRRGVAI